MSLTDLKDPPDTEPGWKLDPTGVGDWRWWNGEKWIAEVAGEPARKWTFWDRIMDLPIWARFALPLAVLVVAGLEYLRWTSDGPLDLIWLFLP